MNSKFKTLQELATDRVGWAKSGKKVVWTNGCFDLIHAGHIRSLRDAKALGDILIVGINSDLSVRNIKGRLRPIVCEQDRAEVLAALEPVDFVTIFDEPDPVAAIALIRPDIHCKGEEYKDGARPLPERDAVESYGGEIHFLALHPGRSTSELITRIIAAEGAK